MRVAVLTTSFPLWPGSSSGIFIQRLLASFSDSIETTVITPCTTTPFCTEGAGSSRYTVRCFRYAPMALQRLAHSPGGIPVALRNHKLLYLLLPSFFMAMFLVCLSQAKRSDIVHANWSVNGIMAGLAGKLARIAVVTTLRGEDVNRSQDSLVNALLLRACLALSCRVVVVSEAIYSTIAKRFPTQAHKLVLIPNGVDEDLLRRGRRGGALKLRLLTIGSLIPRKGLDQILIALSRLKVAKDFELTMVGDGPERLALESLTTSLKLGDRVLFAGAVKPKEIPSYLEAADIFVLASHSEGRPNVILEAMAVGLPVIASNIEGVNELIKGGETGLLFEPGKPEQLARRIDQLDQNPELRKRLGEQGRRFIIENQLVWRETARRYIGVYKDCISHGRSGS